MRQNDQLLLMGNEVLMLESNGETTNLPQMVGTVATSLYSTMLEYGEAEKDKDKEQINRLEKKIRLQSTALKSLSDACMATHEART